MKNHYVFRTDALTAPQSRDDEKSFARRVRETYPRNMLAGARWPSFFFPVLIVFIVTVFGGSASISNAAAPWQVMVGILLILVGFSLPITWILQVVIGRRRQRARWLRLSRFAEQNRMKYEPYSASAQVVFARAVRSWMGSSRDGALLRSQFTQVGINILSARAGKVGASRLVIGTVRTITSTSKGGTIWQDTDVVQVGLQNPMPHILLDSKRNNRLTWQTRVASGIKPSQRLSLEGDFDDTFTLYCPEGYERDALYLFTPDVMALVLDACGHCDIEILDDKLNFYGKNLASTDPRKWTALTELLTQLEKKLGQWGRWRDDKTLSDESVAAYINSRRQPSVADEGQRLRRYIPWWMWVIIICAAGVAVVALGGSLLAMIAGVISLIFH